MVTRSRRASRKPWGQLSPAYRRRLERAGITAADYRAGANLSAARGHAATPEHPESAERRPQHYKRYLLRHGKEMRVITTTGIQWLAGMTFKDRSLVGTHENAVKRYIEGNTSPAILQSLFRGPAGLRHLSDFRGKTVSGWTDDEPERRTVELEYRPDMLDARYYRGELTFETIYRTAS